MHRELANRMKELGYNDHMIRLATERITELQQSGVKGLEKFVRKLVDRLSDKEAYLDILMEGRFAIILARNNFSNIYIEYDRSGPDLKANWNGKTIFFEVTRKHPKENEWAKNRKVGVIRPIPIDTIVEKITCKLPQLKMDEINIVVVWSATISLGTHEFKAAYSKLMNTINTSPQKYKNLSGCLFTDDGGVNTSDLKQFYFFKNDTALKKPGVRLTKKLESLYEQNVRKLQREIKELATAMQRLNS